MSMKETTTEAIINNTVSANPFGLSSLPKMFSLGEIKMTGLIHSYPV